jgi:hypothetical protein
MYLQKFVKVDVHVLREANRALHCLSTEERVRWWRSGSLRTDQHAALNPIQ